MKVTLSDADVADLVLQRTNAFIRLGGGAALDHWFKTGDKAPLYSYLESNGQTKEFIQAALAEIETEFRVIQPFIADLDVETVVSIGRGWVFSKC